MSNFFELNIPMSPPDYMHASLAKNYAMLAQRMDARFRKLNEALAVSGMEPNRFHRCARIVFGDGKDENRVHHFDNMSAKNLAECCKTLDDGTPVMARLDWPNADVVIDTAFTATKEWEVLRVLGIGGSEVSIIRGINPWTSERRLYHNKVGTPLYDTEDGRDQVFLRGHVIEDYVINAFCKITGATRLPETRMFRSKTHPHATANVDAFLKFPNGDIYLYEAKSTTVANWAHWAGDRIPPYYTTQMRQYPAVLADDRIKGTYIGCLMCDDQKIAKMYVGSIFDEREGFFSHFLMRDAEEERKLLDMVEDWWHSYPEPNIEPDPAGIADLVNDDLAAKIGPSDPTLKPIRLKYADYKDALTTYDQLRMERRSLEEQIKDIKVMEKNVLTPLLEEMGAATQAHLITDRDTFYDIRFAGSMKPSVDTKSLKEFFPEAAAACITVSESERSIRVSEKNISKLKK